MTGLIAFMNGPVGRLVRLVGGLALLWFGFLGPAQGTNLGVVIGVLGIVMALLGIWGRCLLEFVTRK